MGNVHQSKRESSQWLDQDQNLTTGGLGRTSPDEVAGRRGSQFLGKLKQIRQLVNRLCTNSPYRPSSLCNLCALCLSG